VSLNTLTGRIAIPEPRTIIGHGEAQSQGKYDGHGAQARGDKASQADAPLHAYHSLGLKVIARAKEATLDTVTLQKLSEETGYCADNLRKARVIVARYSAGLIDELCYLRTPEGMAGRYPLATPRHLATMTSAYDGVGGDHDCDEGETWVRRQRLRPAGIAGLPRRGPGSCTGTEPSRSTSTF
jgi:hypothetical protein